MSPSKSHREIEDGLTIIFFFFSLIYVRSQSTSQEEFSRRFEEATIKSSSAGSCFWIETMYVSMIVKYLQVLRDIWFLAIRSACTYIHD